MHFSKNFEDDKEYEIIECTKLENNILIMKEKLDENRHYVVKLRENQYAVLFEKGKIYDSIKEEGIYTIKDEPSSSFDQDFIDYEIKENEDKLCILFFNMNTITGNKFYIKKKHKTSFFGEGTFDFKIKNPLKLFNKVITVRSIYSREELLEQIRERITKIAISVIKQNQGTYILNKDIISSNLNVFEDYGITIVSSNLENIEFKN